MALFDTTWYCNFGNGTSTGYYAVTVRPQNTAVAAGVLRRQFTAPAVGSERVFVCIVAGTTANVTDATWVLTRGAKTTDGTATWQECTGASAVNGDATNTPVWTAATAYTLGAIVKRVNAASYWICSTAGTSGGSEPAWANDTAGTTRTDNTATWTCLGVVGNFTGGQAPHARLANVLTSTWFAGGNTVYVGDNHAEAQTTQITISPTSTHPSVAKILCHSSSGSYPPTALTTGASLSTTTNNNISISGFSGGIYFYGVTFKAAVGVSTSTANISIQPSGGSYCYLDNCSLWLADTAVAGTSAIFLGSSSSLTGNIVFNNTTVKFGAVANSINLGVTQFLWQNTGQVLAAGSSVPSTFLFYGGSAQPSLSTTVLEALDLSQLTGAFNANLNSTNIGTVSVKDCKLNAAMSVVQPSVPGFTIQFVRCDSGATAYKSSRYAYEGTETTETTITRVGGAVDPTGQAQSRKIVTTANALWLRPFQAEPYAIWNPTTGANVTVTVYGTINAGAVPNNDDIWIEVEYLGSAATPLGSFITSTKANLLTTAAAVASDGSTWNGGGSGVGWSPFKLSVTLSAPQPGLIGYLDARVRAAKPSATYYIDPKIELT